MSVNSFTQSGSKSTTVAKLPNNVFKVDIKNHNLLKEAYLAYMANGRQNLAKTLKRGEVRGGGKKPWRQKGTGRARFGSTRNPIWRSGGVAFGPTGSENYTRTLSTKSKRLALCQSLTLAAKDKNICLVDSINIKDSKTQNLKKYLVKIGADNRALIVVGTIDNELKLASQNLADVKVSNVKNLNVFDVLNCDSLVLTKDSIKPIEDRLGDKTL